MSQHQPRQHAGRPEGGQYATTPRAETGLDLSEPAPGLLCDECGADMMIDATGVSNHLDEDGNVDHDADGDHVAYTTDIPTNATDAELAGLLDEARDDYDHAQGDRRAVTARRMNAVDLAANPEAARPDWSHYANPCTLTEVRKAIRGAATGKVRGIILRHEATQRLDGSLEIAGPKDGTPLYVDIVGGFSPLRVTSGTVVVNARSSMGNGVDVGPDSTVVVLADPGRKVSTTVDGGVAVVVGADEARGLQYNRGGSLDVVSAGRMTVSEASKDSPAGTNPGSPGTERA